MITLQDILLFEQLQNKSFMDFDGGLDDCLTLMYVHDHDNRRNCTLKHYRKTNKDALNMGNPSKDLRRFLAMVQADMQYINQFSHPIVDEEQSEKKHDKLTPAIQSLLFHGGINVQWLMQQGLDMLPILTEGLDSMIRREKEEQRFNILQLIAPHIKESAFMQLKRRWKFPWEEPQQQQEISESLNNKIARFIFGKKKNE